VHHDAVTHTQLVHHDTRTHTESRSYDAVVDPDPLAPSNSADALSGFLLLAGLLAAAGAGKYALNKDVLAEAVAQWSNSGSVLPAAVATHLVALAAISPEALTAAQAAFSEIVAGTLDSTSTPAVDGSAAPAADGASLDASANASVWASSDAIDNSDFGAADNAPAQQPQDTPPSGRETAAARAAFDSWLASKPQPPSSQNPLERIVGFWNDTSSQARSGARSLLYDLAETGNTANAIFSNPQTWERRGPARAQHRRRARGSARTGAPDRRRCDPGGG
jgi:hypothetical protein